MSELKFLTTTKRKTLYSFNPDADEIVARAVGREKYYEYRRLWRETSRVEIELDFPLQLDIELNSGCNLACPICPSDLREVEPKMVLMDLELYRDIIDEGMRHGLRAVNLNFVNEPLLRKDISDFVSYAREKGVLDIMFNTNGMLLTKDMSHRLIKAGLTKLSVSFDGFTKETYEKIRPGGNFDRVKRNMLDFLKMREKFDSKLPLLKLTYLVTALNGGELDDFLDFWQDKADLVSLQNLSNPYEGEQSEQLKRTYGFDNGGRDIDTEYRCPHPFQRMSIRYDGTVLPCCHFRGIGLIIGNVKEKGIYDIYHTPPAEEIRRRHKNAEYYKIPVCYGCIMNTPVRKFK